MPITFPSSPSSGQQYTAGTKTWEWNGTAWVQVAATANIGDSAVTTAKLATGSVTADKIADGTIVAAEIASGAVTADKIGAGAVTSAKLAVGAVDATALGSGAVTSAKLGTGAVDAAAIGTGAVTNAKLAANSVTQAKLDSALTAVTVTTSANRSTAIPSPFVGQLAFLTDTSKLTVYTASGWIVISMAPPDAPTSLAAVPSGTSVSISFTAGFDNGAAITNYQYALSTNGGSTYGSWTAFDPVDTTSPVVISGLLTGTAYYVKIRAVNGIGAGAESSALSFSTLSVPDAPTSLNATNIGATTVDISFTAGSPGGSAITNYKYALSTDSGATYSSYAALSPADASSPITITGLNQQTTYTVKLRAVSSIGDGIESSSISFTTALTFSVDYLIVGGGAGGDAGYAGGGGGAGGVRSSVSSTGGGGSLESAFSFATNSSYSVTVGAGGAATGNVAGQQGNAGNSSTVSTVTSNGGGRPGGNGNGGGGGGGGGNATNATGGAATSGQGYGGGNGGRPCVIYTGGGGGGAGGAGSAGYCPTSDTGVGGAGGNGVSNSISGSSVTYGGGGGGGAAESSRSGTGGSGGSGGGGAGSGGPASNPGSSGTANTGGGGGGAGNYSSWSGTTTPAGGAGGSGVIILRYPSARTITLGAGLTGSTSTVGGNKVTTITAGSGNVSWV